MAPVAYSGTHSHASHTHAHQGPPQPHHTSQLYQPQPQPQNRHMAQQQALAALNGQHNHPHHLSAGGIQKRPTGQLSKRGSSNVGDAVVPQHAHGHGGVHSLNDSDAHAHAHAHRDSGLFTTRMKPRTGATMEDIARRVRVQSDRFQQAVLPAAEAIKGFAESSPVVFTFVAIFATLSIVPLLIFIGFVTAIAVFSTGLAAIFLSFSVAGTVMFGLTFLIPILLITGTIAVFSVCLLLALFLGHRLFLHLSEANTKINMDVTESTASTAAEVLSAGVRTWWDETRSRVGLGPYRLRVTAFEDHKAYADPQRDYSKQHPQPTPSQLGPRAVSGTVKIEREDSGPGVDTSGDVFSPQGIPQLLPAAEVTAVKREPEDGWSTDSEEKRK